MNIGKTGWVRVFQLAGNYRPEEEASESCNRHTKNQFGVVRQSHGKSWVKACPQKKNKGSCFCCAHNKNMAKNSIKKLPETGK